MLETLAALMDFLMQLVMLIFQKYSEPCYVITDTIGYKIEKGFPRICATDLLPGISDVSYRIDLSQCDDFEGAPDWMVNAMNTIDEYFEEFRQVYSRPFVCGRRLLYVHIHGEDV